MRLVPDSRVVDNGRIVTAGGLSAGIDGALHVVTKMFGEAHARQVANNMEYDWRPEGPWSRALLADLHLQEVLDFYPPLTDRVTEEYEGDETRWSLRYRVRWQREAAEIRGQLEEATAHFGWEPIALAGASGESTSGWEHTDRFGRRWRTMVSVETDAGTGEILLTAHTAILPGGDPSETPRRGVPWAVESAPRVTATRAIS